MKRLLLALPLILIGSPALAEKWVTAASIPYDFTKSQSTLSIIRLMSTAFAKTADSRQREPHGITEMIQ